MKKKAVSLVILASMFIGGQAVGIIPDTTEVVASAATTYTGVVNADVLNVRSTSSTSGKVLGKLKNGTKVTVVEKCSNGWYKIKYNSGYGYVSGQYVTIQNNNNNKTTTGVVNADVLNVRSTSSTSGKVLGKLNNGAKVTIVEKCSNGWYKIKYNSGYGYVSGQYITIQDNNKNNNSTTAQKVVAEAKKHIGTPYKWGGTTTAGFDCSGFTQYVMNKCGIKIGRTTKDQINNGTSVAKANLKAGDLVFFKNTYSGCTNPSHVGIYIGGNQVIHAGDSGVKISQLNSSYYTEHYYGARRVIK